MCHDVVAWLGEGQNENLVIGLGCEELYLQVAEKDSSEEAPILS